MNSLNLGWNFDNSYIHLPEKLFSKQGPIPVRNPELIILNHDIAQLLSLDLKDLETNEGLQILAGNILPQGADPIAQAYAGHQFGHFAMLGDGRAILLGEQINSRGERFDIQLKGSGRTPYSRGGDGRAALGPMLREYIISEAMYSLKIPTTRSLAVVTTGESIYRGSKLKGAILTRVAKSHIRIGTFQFAAKYTSKEDLRLLADYTILRHYSDYISDDKRYINLLREVIKAQAHLIAKWQLVGFIHGVMNTDNMVLSGETIDYGPCAFMDIYHPDTVFSSIDTYGRYAYKNQPMIGAWNLARFAETLLPLLDENEEKAVSIANEQLSEFKRLFDKYYLKGMCSKLGLFDQRPENIDLINDLLGLMEKYKADYTNTFIGLTLDDFKDQTLFNIEDFTEWHKRYRARIDAQDQGIDKVKDLMKKNNPYVIPRNHRVEEALASAEDGDLSPMNRLLSALSNPYSYTKEQEEYCLVPESNEPYRTFCGT
ncbi:YdiU family protein [Tissierella creatinini]|nr:YdiU family protein [Tissierella creatinini]TJX63108.1 YdiU family protein [Soehngenia saccharolytica]